MRIRNARGRTDGNSGYTRVLGNDRLGQLMSRVQATVIANGNELEKMIVERSNTIENLETSYCLFCASKMLRGILPFNISFISNPSILPDAPVSH